MPEDIYIDVLPVTPAAVIAVVEAYGEAAPDATVNVNGNLFDTVAAGGIKNVPVKNSNDVEVGTIIANEVIIGVGHNLVKDTAGTTLVDTAMHAQETEVTVILDSNISINGVAFADVLAQADLNVVVKDTSGAAVGSKIGSEWIVPFNRDATIKGYFGSGEDEMDTLTIDSDTAGTYTAISQDGSSGDITISKNGGAFAAFSNPLALVATDTIVVKRTITATAGYFKLTGTYV